MGSSAGTGAQAPRLKRPPSPLIWKGLLVIGVVGRVAAESQASEARRLADAEASRIAAEEARRTDSIRLTTAVDSGAALSSERVWQLDWTLHSAPFVIPHDALHRRVVGLQLDSAARVIRRASRDITYATAARQLLATVQAPLTPRQAKREAELSGQMGRIDRRLMLEASRREPRARSLAQTRQSLQATPPRSRIQRPRSTVPFGATARCRDGTYSHSTSRRGTCSHHGGVAEWL